jgi:hypothetical protein
MRRSIMILLASAALATAAAAQVPLSQITAETGITIRGEVAEIFGHRFILEEDGERILVEAPEGAGRLDLDRGEAVIVSGHPRAGSFEALRILREDGSPLALGDPAATAAPERDGTAAAPDGREGAAAQAPMVAMPAAPRGRPGAGSHAMENPALAALDLAAVEILEERGRNTILLGETRGGDRIRIEINRHDEIREIETIGEPVEGLDLARILPPPLVERVAPHIGDTVTRVRLTGRHVHVDSIGADGMETRHRFGRDGMLRSESAPEPAAVRTALPPDRLRSLAAAAGYKFRRIEGFGPRHAEIVAVNPFGEEVRVRIDRSGRFVAERALELAREAPGQSRQGGER